MIEIYIDEDDDCPLDWCCAGWVDTCNGGTGRCDLCKGRGWLSPLNAEDIKQAADYGYKLMPKE